jgi:ferredoxin like protein
VPNRKFPLEVLEGSDSVYMKTDDKLALNLFHVDNEPHIKVDQEICQRCPHKFCTYICPAENYTLNEDGGVVFSWEGCLECGTCRIICDQGAITWDYPMGGYGISYRF